MAAGLSAAVRRNVVTLQKLAAELERVQAQFATGRKVNGPSDSPSAFFTEAALNARAAALETVIDGIGNSKRTLEAAGHGIDGIEGLISNARSLVHRALSSPSTFADVKGSVAGLTGGTTAGSVNALRQSMAQQFDLLLSQIDMIAADAGFNGQNLLGGSAVTVAFNEDGSATMTIAGSLITSANLGIDAAAGGFQSDADISAALADLDTATAVLKSMAASYGTSLALVSIREDFARSMSNLLTAGADNLVLADANCEAATLLALKARQDVVGTSLSLASKADQTVLRLFGASQARPAQ